MSYATREQQNAYSKAHYQANKASYFARNQKYHQKLRDYLNALKEKPCEDCAQKYPPVVMDFDHREGSKKTANLSRLAHYSLERIKAEVAKCDLVCANCHRLRTYERQEAKTRLG